MKKLILPVILLFLLQQSCKDSGTNPPPGNPPGWQEDIPWPSLADSPWPILHHDPQQTGRSKLNGPVQGLIDWIFSEPSKQIISSLVVGSDSIIYAPYENAGLIAIKPNGEIKWKVLTDHIATASTPIITSNGLIIYFTQAGVFGINEDGSQNWFYPLQGMTDYGVNIGLEGTIYFITNHQLFAINSNGQFEWSFSSSEFEGVSSLSFSPDGKTLYIPGNINTPALIAFDIINRTIKWRFGSGGTQWSVIDSYGNIFVSAFVDTINSGRGTLFSLKPDGSINWYKEHISWSVLGGFSRSSLAQPTLDKNGNLYFVSDSIYSVDYAGRVRWRKKFEGDGFVTTPLVSDVNGNIYVIKEKFQKFDLFVFSNNGVALYNILDIEDYPGQSPLITFGRLFVPSGKGENIFSFK